MLAPDKMTMFLPYMSRDLLLGMAAYIGIGTYEGISVRFQKPGSLAGSLL